MFSGIPAVNWLFYQPLKFLVLISVWYRLFLCRLTSLVSGFHVFLSKGHILKNKSIKTFWTCLKCMVKIRERRQWHDASVIGVVDVFGFFIVKFEDISLLLVVFLRLKFNMYLFAWNSFTANASMIKKQLHLIILVSIWWDHWF